MILTRKHFGAFRSALNGTPVIEAMVAARQSVQFQIQIFIGHAVRNGQPFERLLDVNTHLAVSEYQGYIDRIQHLLELDETARVTAALLMSRSCRFMDETPVDIDWTVQDKEIRRMTRLDAHHRKLIGLFADAVWLDVKASIPSIDENEYPAQFIEVLNGDYTRDIPTSTIARDLAELISASS